LPTPGEILVRIGERVGPSRKIGRCPARGEVGVVNVAHILGLDNPDLSQVMVKRCGDRVKVGEILAARRGLLPFWHKPCRSPVSGRLVAIGHGWVLIETETFPHAEASIPLNGLAGRQEESIAGGRTHPGTMDRLAFVAGQVTAVTEHRSVIIETIGTHIVGACGVGGEGYGVLQVAVKDSAQVLSAEHIGPGLNNAVLVGGASVSPEALDRAVEMRVRGIIVGGISPLLHSRSPATPFPIVATEGYGNLPMSATVFRILEGLEGREASLSGQMGGTWDDARPAIYVPQDDLQEDGENPPTAGATMEPVGVGDRVRALRPPLQGQVGEIVSLVMEAQSVSSGLSLSGAQVAFGDAVHFVPWLNLERLN
jgi:hypothetical protein